MTPAVPLALAGALGALGPLGVALGVALGPERGSTHRAVYGGALALSVALAATGLIALAAPPATLRLPLFLPWIGARFALDPLAGFFLVVVNLGGAASSLYALGHAAPGSHHGPDPARVLPFFPVFLAAMNLVLLAADAFGFLLAWEAMSLASWALVIADHRDRAARDAAYLYLLMAMISGLLLLFAFGAMAGPGGGYGFAAMRAAHPTAWVAAAALLLALAGAGAKAGLIPLHTWLPEAHPAAPSHVSALMSGVMTKVAVYAFLRVAFDLLGRPPWWAALPVLALGAASAVLGVLRAGLERDLKRALAQSTIENIGIVFIGIGLATAFRADGDRAAAALALTAALFHVLGHAAMKSLLFLGAGAVQSATGTRQLDRLGGLIGRMPVTALFMLIGCAAIAGLPPLTGFVSEWLTFQAILLHPDLPQWGLKVMVPAAGALLALSAALAAGAFVRIYGVAFLGRPRSPEAAAAPETDIPARAAMAGLAALCLLLGVFPGVVIDALAPVTRELLGVSLPTQLGRAWLRIVPVADARGSYDGLLILLFVAAATALTAVAIHRFASRAIRRAAPWDCGFPDPSPFTQYTADSFAQPIRRVFAAPLFGARERVFMPPPGDTAPARIEKHLADPIWDALYAPVAGFVALVALRLNVLQFLTIRRYLMAVFLALIALLLTVTLWH